MAEAQQIIIELVSDASGLQPAEDRLEALGKIDSKSATIFKNTNAELAKRQAVLKSIADGTTAVTVSATKEQAVYNKLITSLKNLSGASKQTVQDLLKLSPKEVAAGFDNAATNVDDFIKVMQGASEGAVDWETKSVSLKQELKSLTAQIAELKLNNEDTGDSFTALVERAGKIKDALSDAGAEVKNFSSDSRTIDNLIGSVSALAGGYSAVQGAAAIFGDENKDLQETLVKVSASMAVLQGIQQLQNALQKEGALTLAALNIQEKLYDASLAVENALQSESAVVRGLATVAQIALNTAMKANPIGLLITAIAAIVSVFAFFISRAHDAAVAQGKLNQAIKDGSEGLDSYVAGSKRGLDQIVSDLEKAGARQTDIQKQGGLASADIINKRLEQIKKLNKEILDTEKSTNADIVETRGKAIDLVTKLEQDNADAIVELHKQQNAYDKQLIAENLSDRLEAQKKILAQSAEGTKAQLAAQIALIKAQAALDQNDAGQDFAKRAAIAAQANKDILAADIAFQRRSAELRKQDLEIQIDNAKTADATLEELHILQLRRITAEADAEVLDTAKSAKEKAEIRKKEFADRLAEDKAFNEESRRQVLQAEIDRNKVILDARNLSSDDQLRAEIENITLAAQIEIDATKNNAQKVKEIIAQRDKDIRAARLATIQKDLEEDLKRTAVNNAPIERSITRQQEQLEESFAKRKISTAGYYAYTVELIKAQEKIALDSNEKQFQALTQTYLEGNISDKDYTDQYEELADKRVEITESAEEKIRKAAQKTSEEKKKRQEDDLNFLIQTTEQVGNIYLSFFQNQLDAQQQQIDAKKKQIQDLQDQGKITDKEASARLKQLAKEEAKIKHDQAVKDKEAAIFEATIATFQAVIKTYGQAGFFGGTFGAAIVAAIGAAQIAAIAARPIPQFYGGKKDGYEGPGLVGDRGFELVERADGSMHVQRKKEIIWLGKDDTVYTNDETRRILASRPAMRKMPEGSTVVNNNVNIDYDKIGKAVAKHAKTNVYVDGIHAEQIEQNNHTNYLNARRQYKR